MSNTIKTNIAKNTCLILSLFVSFFSCSPKVIAPLISIENKVTEKDSALASLQKKRPFHAEETIPFFTWMPQACYEKKKIQFLAPESNRILYQFLQKKMNAITTALKIKDAILVRVVKDSPFVSFVDEDTFYLSITQLKRYQNTSEMMSFLIHEIVHNLYQDKQFALLQQNSQQQFCKNGQLDLQTSNVFFRVSAWKTKEFKTDSITLLTLLQLNYYPLSFCDQADNKISFYAEECNAFKDVRVVKINQLWLGLGMPSHALYKQEYESIKQQLIEK